MRPLAPDTEEGDCAAVLRYFLAAADGAPMRERLNGMCHAIGLRRARPSPFVRSDGLPVNLSPFEEGRRLLCAIVKRAPAPFAAGLHGFATMARLQGCAATLAGVASIAGLSVGELRALGGDGPEPSIDEVLQRIDRLAGVGS